MQLVLWNSPFFIHETNFHEFQEMAFVQAARCAAMNVVGPSAFVLLLHVVGTSAFLPSAMHLSRTLKTSLFVARPAPGLERGFSRALPQKRASASAQSLSMQRRTNDDDGDLPQGGMISSKSDEGNYNERDIAVLSTSGEDEKSSDEGVYEATENFETRQAEIQKTRSILLVVAALYGTNFGSIKLMQEQVRTCV